MTELSPAAQNVLDTTYNTFDLQDSHSLRKTVAATFRAAALYCKRDRIQLLVIADELEANV